MMLPPSLPPSGGEKEASTCTPESQREERPFGIGRERREAIFRCPEQLGNREAEKEGEGEERREKERSALVY